MEEKYLKLLVEIDWLFAGGPTDVQLFQWLEANLIFVIPKYRCHFVLRRWVE